MTEALKLLYQYQDKEYVKFQAKLTPGIDESLFIGVRVPDIRKIAKIYKNSNESKVFLENLPHMYYDENMLHGCLIMEMNDYETCIKKVDEFLPYIDNWAVCDIMSPKCFKKHKSELMSKIKEWCHSSKTYTIRFGIEMLMSYFLDDDFKKEYLDIPAKVKSDEYYVNMMIAWFFATALAKQWEPTIKYIENNVLCTWVHNKTIQKAIESYRITDDQKNYLRSLKRSH